MAGFRTFHPYYDECGKFYGDSFDDCLKQVVSLYPHLDSSQVVIDHTMLSTLGGADAVMDEADGSIYMVKEEVKEPANAEAVDQQVLEG